MLLALAMLVQAAPFDLGTLRRQVAPGALTGCAGAGAPGDEIVVCGRGPDRHRLPLPVERDSEAVVSSRGDAPSGAAVLVPPGRCGLFAGERRCSKAEAARYGYGNGRDPITQLMRLGRALIDPGADTGLPPSVARATGGS